MLPRFSVVPGRVVQRLLEDTAQVMDVIQHAYAEHGRGATVNPDSYFLRFPDDPSARIIALPARLGEPSSSSSVAGLKWIASFPSNVSDGAPRASAVLILNDARTGYPYACIEAAGLSAARTAASAALVANALTRTHPSDGSVGIIGAGVIARQVVAYLISSGFPVEQFLVHDLDERSAEHLVRYAEGAGTPARRATKELVLGCQCVVTATTAVQPHISRPPLRGQTYLNISLRDFTPSALMGAHNVVDDVDHCLKADTSPHLVEQATGARDFVSGTIPQLLSGELCLSPDRGVVVSPFGLGVLDLALGRHIFQSARDRHQDVPIEGFFGESRRW